MRSGGPCRALLLVAALLLVPVASATAQHIDSEDALLVTSARRAIERGDHRRAALLLDRALRVNPRRIDAYVLRASVHAVTRQHSRGVLLLRRARRLAPRNPDVLTALGAQLILSRRAAEGVPLLERVTRTFPRRYQAHAILGHHYNNARRWAEAIRAFRSYLRWRPAELAGSDRVHRLGLAEALLRSGDARAARTIYRSVLSEDRSSLVARLGLAWAEVAIDCRRGLEALAKLSGLTRRHPPIALVQGRCALRLRRTAAAQAAATRYLALRPDDAAGHALLGRAFEQAGRLPQARASLEAAVARDPRRVAYAIDLARLERRAGDPAAAIARLRRHGAPRGQTLRVRWKIELAESLSAAGRHAEVRDLLDGAFFAGGGGSAVQLATARLLVGIAHLELGDSAAGLALLERVARGRLAKRARPSLRRAYLAMARSAVDRGDLEAAESGLSRLVRIGIDADGQRLLGLVRLLRGRPAAAIAPLRAAVAAAPNDSLARLLLGRAQRLGKDPTGAQATLRAALAIDGLDEQRRYDLSVELVVAASDSSPRTALSFLEALPRGLRSPKLRQKAANAYHELARKVATGWLRSGAHRRAHALLERLSKKLGAGDSRLRDVLCDLALAATGARLHRAALAALRRLPRRATCPFAAPADRLAVPILTAWNRGMLGQAVRSMQELQRLQRRATGSAAVLARAAARDLAIRAAAEAYDRGHIARARLYLRRAAAIDRDSPEMQHNQAVLMLASRQVDAAIGALEKVAPRVPEAWVNVGIAHDRKGRPRRALQAYRRAYRSGVRMGGKLRRWIATKERLWGKR